MASRLENTGFVSFSSAGAKRGGGLKKKRFPKPFPGGEGDVPALPVLSQDHIYYGLFW